jgi:hypothetical protein
MHAQRFSRPSRSPPLRHLSRDPPHRRALLSGQPATLG